MIIKELLRTVRTRIKRIVLSKKKPIYKTIKVGGFSLKSFYDSKIEEFLSVYPNYSRNFARLAECVLKNDHNQSSIIDVGANIGDTAALLRSLNIPNTIFCIEGDQSYFELLKENTFQFDDVVPINCFLSDANQTISASFDHYQGTGHLTEITNGKKIITKTLDNLANEQPMRKIKILKIDTDGFDVRILNGAIQLIKANDPILFFEYDTVLNTYHQSCIDFLFFLVTLGYLHVIFYDNFGRMVMHTGLNSKDTVIQLDRYINKKKGAFPYYDVAVFTVKDEDLFNEVIMQETNL